MAQNGLRIRRVELALPGHSDLLVQVWSITEDADGSIWMGTKFGLIRVEPSGAIVQFPVQTTRPTDHVLALCIDRSGLLWAAHETGLIMYRPEAPNAVATASAGHAARVETTLSEALARASLNTGVSGRLTTPSSAGQAQFLYLPDVTAPGGVTAIHLYADGRLWICTRAGVYEVSGDRWRLVDLGHKSIAGPQEILEDEGGNVWLTSATAGAEKISRSGFVTYGAADGLHEPVNAVLDDGRGGLLIAMGSYELAWFDGQRFASKVLINTPGKGDRWVARQSLMRDHLGDWWAATRMGLYRFSSSGTATGSPVGPLKAIYTTKDGLPDNYVVHLFEDSRGDVWVSNFTPEHVVVLRWERANGRFLPYTDKDGLPAFSEPTSFSEDRDGNLWISFREGGIARYRDGVFRYFGVKDGLPAATMTDCAPDHAGRLWCSSMEHGIFRIDHPNETPLGPINYTTAQGLGRNGAIALAEDASGLIYTASTQGTDRIDPVGGSAVHFGSADGLAPGHVLNVFRDRKGTLWFSAVSGLSRIEARPEPEKRHAAAPVFISAVRVGDADVRISPVGEREVQLGDLPRRTNSLRIEYLSVNVAGTEPAMFEYRLEGGDGRWGQPTSLGSVNYAGLAPGDYRFAVRLAGVEGAAAAVAFHIMRPVWLRWWAVTLLLLALSTAAWALDRFRVHRLEAVRRSREERIAELERVRRRIATDLHDDIGSSLTQIAIVSQVLQQRMGTADGAMTEGLASISRASRELIDSMSDIVWAINPQRDHLSDLAHRMRRFAADTFTASNIAFTLDLPAEERDMRLEGNLRREVFLIFKESVNNLVRHSGCTSAALALRLTEIGLELEVADNGKGFDPRAQFDGHGVASMRSRAEEIGAAFELRSEPGKGSTISVRLPVSKQTAARDYASL
jgi:signal transduction histidine kinase/ligand-binding sensor domain-containing protein